MTSRLVVRVGLAVGLSLVALTLACLHLIALTAGGAAQIGHTRLAVLAAGYDRRAEELLSSPAPPRAAVDDAERLTQRALDEFPYDTSSWARLAYIDRLRHPQLTAVGVAALTKSYDLVAVDPSIGAWRVHFALENWDKLPKSLKDSSRAEAKALSTVWASKVKLRAALTTVESPVGATMATLWLQRYVTIPSPAEHR